MEFNFVAFVYLKKYEINFRTKFSSNWFTGLSIVTSCFYFFWSLWGYDIKFHTKDFEQRSTKYFAYENFFFSVITKSCMYSLLLGLLQVTGHEWNPDNLGYSSFSTNEIMLDSRKSTKEEQKIYTQWLNTF